VDFSRTHGREDCVSVITTRPLTDNETWTPFGAGELMLFADGQPRLHRAIPIPEDVRQSNWRNLACA
jgi:glutamine amidotransferase